MDGQPLIAILKRLSSRPDPATAYMGLVIVSSIIWWLVSDPALMVALFAAGIAGVFCVMAINAIGGRIFRLVDSLDVAADAGWPAVVLMVSATVIGVLIYIFLWLTGMGIVFAAALFGVAAPMKVTAMAGLVLLAHVAVAHVRYRLIRRAHWAVAVGAKGSPEAALRDARAAVLRAWMTDTDRLAKIDAACPAPQFP